MDGVTPLGEGWVNIPTELLDDDVLATVGAFQRAITRLTDYQMVVVAVTPTQEDGSFDWSFYAVLAEER